MRRSLLRYTRILILPLLALGLVLTGCDSGGSDGGDDGIPLTAETARNLQTADLKSQTDAVVSDGDEFTETELKTRYSGDVSGETIVIASRVGTAAQTQYETDITLSSTVSGNKLFGSNGLEAGVDAPSGATGNQTPDALINFYLGEIASKSSASVSTFNAHTTANEVNMSQLVNKLLLGAMAYKEGADALNGIDGISDDDQKKLEKAAEYFGAPDKFDQEFLDYPNGTEGLATSSKDVNGDDQVDFNTEFVHTWAGYAAERSAKTTNVSNSPKNDFAGDFKKAIDKISTAIEKDDSSVDVDAEASKALGAWEKVAAVNVIHYLNSMKSDMDAAGLGSDDEVTKSALKDERGGFNEHWGEGKPFAWALQFNTAKKISNTKLKNDIHGELALGASPPYNSNRSSTVTKQDVVNSIDDIQSTLQDVYGFDSDNVGEW